MGEQDKFVKGAATYGHNALNLIPSLAWTIANSRVMAKTPPFEVVSAITLICMKNKTEASRP